MTTDYDRPRIDTFREFFFLVREDWETNFRSWRQPGFQALLMYRIGCLGHGDCIPRHGPRRIFRWIYGRMHWRVRRRYGIELHDTTHVGQRLAIRHQGAIVIGVCVRIGDDCMIRQGVTLGENKLESRKGPTLGNHVIIGANAVVVGDISIGNFAMIGPNTSVHFDVPAEGKVVAARPRIISAQINKADAELSPDV